MPTALNTNEISLTSHDKVNVDTGLQIGEKLMRRYELSWPNGFNATISKGVRQRVWKYKTGRANILSAAKLQSLPPTDESFLLNAMRAHFQACIWTHAAESSPPLLDPLEHGWMQHTVNKILAPLMLPSDVPPAPDSVLKLIKCSCEQAHREEGSRGKCPGARGS